MSPETRAGVEALLLREDRLVLISALIFPDRHEKEVEAVGKRVVGEVVDLLVEVDRGGSEEVEGKGVAGKARGFALHHFRSTFEPQLNLMAAGLVLGVQPECRADVRLECFDRELVEHRRVVAQLRA